MPVKQPIGDIAVIGMAVMGQNIILNMNDHGFTVVAFNRTVSKVDDFLAGAAKGTKIIGAHSAEEMTAHLKRPRRVMLMVKAGQPVDETIDHILPFLEKGDIIIDGGNSLFTDTIRRQQELATKGLLYIGAGISGGEDGARHGPSIMPGGSIEAWPHVKDIFQAIAAKLDDGTPCCDWMGNGGAGHYVKMVHNGIEYGDEQLICEAYQLMRNYLKLPVMQIADIFSEWNKGELDSYLIEITADILKAKDSDGQPLIDKILDTAGQKGTGKWTVINAVELGQPATLISEALFARFTSTLKEQRQTAEKILMGTAIKAPSDASSFIEQLRRALYASKIVSYSQGYMMLMAAATEYSWKLEYANIATVWRGGCIIRSRFLEDIAKAYQRNSNLTNLMIDPFFTKALVEHQAAWRSVVSTAVITGIPVPAMSSGLAFYDAYRSSQLPANLLQAQRDYFGAHTYERIDKPRGEFFHTNWTGHGGKTSSSTYNA